MTILLFVLGGVLVTCGAVACVIPDLPGPMAPSPTDPYRVCNEKVNAIIKAIPDGKKVIWLDFNQDFLQPDGTLTKEVMDDLLHPNAHGYDIWWKAMKPVVDRELGR